MAELEVLEILRTAFALAKGACLFGSVLVHSCLLLRFIFWQDHIQTSVLPVNSRFSEKRRGCFVGYHIAERLLDYNKLL